MVREIAELSPTTRFIEVNGKPVKKQITVADLVDDLEPIYRVDDSKKAKEFKKQIRQNELFIEKFLKQKNLKA